MLTHRDGMFRVWQMTDQGKLCNDEGELDFEGFSTMMQRQLDLYMQRKLIMAMKKCPPLGLNSQPKSLKPSPEIRGLKPPALY